MGLMALSILVILLSMGPIDSLFSMLVILLSIGPIDSRFPMMKLLLLLWLLLRRYNFRGEGDDILCFNVAIVSFKSLFYEDKSEIFYFKIFIYSFTPYNNFCFYSFDFVNNWDFYSSWDFFIEANSSFARRRYYFKSELIFYKLFIFLLAWNSLLSFSIITFSRNYIFLLFFSMVSSNYDIFEFS